MVAVELTFLVLKMWFVAVAVENTLEDRLNALLGFEPSMLANGPLASKIVCTISLRFLLRRSEMKLAGY